MYRPACSYLILIILLALQTISFHDNVLATREYSVEERIHIDELYVKEDAQGGIYTRVDRFTSAKLSSAAHDVAVKEVAALLHMQHQRQPQVNQYHYHNHDGSLQQQVYDQEYYDQFYFVQQQQLHQQQQHHDHQPQAQEPHHSSHEHLQQQQHPNHQYHQQLHQHVLPQNQHHHHNNIHEAYQEHRDQSSQLQQHSRQQKLQFLYEHHHQQSQSHIHQHTQIEWRSESTLVGAGFSELYMHNFATTYPIVGGADHPNQHHASSCNSIDDSILMMQGNLGEPTCDATSHAEATTSATLAGGASGQHHVPKYPHNNNKPSRNSNVESYPLAPQHYHYESSLMTAIRHYWREISGLCLASAIFLNWLFVVVKRRFIASGFTRHIADVASSELVVEADQRLSSSSTPPKSFSKDTTFNNSAHDSAFEENASPISLDDVSTSEESSLGSRPRSISSSPYTPNTSSQPSSSLNSSSYTSDYISRYSSDFDSIQRLGRGGFGIVFEAKNKIDDCHYAVKRICLPLEKEARERVMREVRALAKLDHAGIVRYYNAWLETPPDDWLKQHDAQLGIVHTLDGLSFPSTDGTYDKNGGSNLNTRGDTCDKFGESGDTSNSDFFGNNKSPFSTRRRVNGYSSQYLKGNSSSPSLDIVFEGSGSIRLEAENSTEESEIKVESGLPLEKVYLYIQMQLCRKDTLKDWLRTNCENRDKTTIFDFFYQIVDAVEYVHSRDLIHRDLKPSNIFFSLDGTLKIGDFGLCRAKTNACVGSSLDLKEYAADFSEAVHTEQVGTQLYMSPEQMNGLSYNHKVDIFAMGLILLELLVPFKTQMQRVNVLLKARNNMFSREFKKEHPDEHDLVRLLLDRRPYKRPTATAIKQHELLSNAQLSQPVIERIYHRRRTISSNSSTE